MLLNNVSLPDARGPVNVQVEGKLIKGVFNAGTTVDSSNGLQLTFTNALAFPGLINSHDHLDFNLFPQFGSKTYLSYTEWGNYIHDKYKNEIAKVLKVPILLREQWGILKNLICGVTTVVNHGARIKTGNPLINVHEQYQCLHSVQFEKKWKVKLNNPLTFKGRQPVVIHVGEGADDAAHNEIDQLIRWNKLKKDLVGVHAVAMSNQQALKFKAIVWCPQSNYFLLGKTAAVNHLKNFVPVLFGTDSTLTGNWDIWGHVKLARKTGLLTDKELYDSLHANAAAIWKTNNKTIAAGADADIVVASITDGKQGLNAFFSIMPEAILLVVQHGAIRLFDASLRGQLTGTDLSGFSKFYIRGVCKFVQGNVPALINQIKGFYPEARFPITVD